MRDSSVVCKKGFGYGVVTVYEVVELQRTGRFGKKHGFGTVEGWFCRGFGRYVGVLCFWVGFVPVSGAIGSGTNRLPLARIIDFSNKF